MSTALQRLPEVSEAVLAGLAPFPAGLPVHQVAQMIGENPHVTSLACRSLRARGLVTWARRCGSREWLVRLRDGPPQQQGPAIPFADFAREMGFAAYEITVVDRVAA